MIQKKYLVAISVMILIVVFVFYNSPKTYSVIGETPSVGLVGHWALDDATGTVASDLSGNGYNATLINNPTWVPGIAGSALSFTANTGSLNNYVSFPSALQNTNFPTNGTLSFWVNGDFTNQDKLAVFETTTASRNHFFVRTRLNNILQIAFQDAGGYLSQKGSVVYQAPDISDNTFIPIAANTWTHITIVWDTTNDMGYIYENGALKLSFYWGAYNNSWTPNGQVFRFGATSGAATDAIDDIALYNRPLSSAEIQAIYAGASAPPVDAVAPSTPANLVASSIAPNQIALGWDASNDNEVIGGYVISRNGIPIGAASATSLSYTDTGLASSTTYTYTIYAVDTSGNKSANSASVIGITTDTHLLYHSDFEEDNTNISAEIGGWRQSGPNDAAVSVTTEKSRAGTKAVKFNFNYSDWNGNDAANGKRAEIYSYTPEFKLGETFWVGFSQYLPADWQDDLSQNGEVIWQFHGAPGGPSTGGPPPLALYIYQGTEELRVNLSSTSTIYLATMPVAPDKGKWTDWVLQLNFNFDGGIVKAWKNGIQVADYYGPTIYHSLNETNQNGPHMQLGVYKFLWGTYPTQVSNRTLFLDEIRVSDSTLSCNDVKPSGASLCADTVAPVVAITAPTNSATVSGIVSVNASATDDVSGVAKVEFYADEILIGTDTTVPYSASWNTTSYVHNTTHTITAKAYDVSGNVSTSSSVIVKVSDITPPTVSITSPPNNTTIPRHSTVTVQANASDVSGISKVEFSVNGSLKCTDTSTPYSCAWIVPPQKNVIYMLQAKAYDVANNIGTSATVAVTSK